MNILVLNAGISSLKFALYSLKSERQTTGFSENTPIAHGKVSGIGTNSSALVIKPVNKAEQVFHVTISSAFEAIEQIISSLARHHGPVLPGHAWVDLVGCHVGSNTYKYTESVRVTSAVVTEIRSANQTLDPQAAIDAEVIESASSLLPCVPIIAVFDTPLQDAKSDDSEDPCGPLLGNRLTARGSNYHKISHRYVANRTALLLENSKYGSRLVTCYLGNEASVSAAKNGDSFPGDTTAVPVGGRPIKTDLSETDHRIIFYLAQAIGINTDLLDSMDENISGSAHKGREKAIPELELAAISGDSLAELKLDVLAYRIAKQIACYATALEGLDVIAFTGPIGECSPSLRSRICRRLMFMGVRLDAVANQRSGNLCEMLISSDRSSISVWTIPTDELYHIACEVRRVALSEPTRRINRPQPIDNESTSHKNRASWRSGSVQPGSVGSAAHTYFRPQGGLFLPAMDLRTQDREF